MEKNLLFSFEGLTFRSLVMIARWTHLYPFRTQKLSILVVTIAMRAIVKITSCQATVNLVFID